MVNYLFKNQTFEDFELVDDSKYSKEFEKEFNENPLTKHVILLYELNKLNTAKDIIKHLAELNIEKGSEVLAAKSSRTNVGRYDYSIREYLKKHHMKKDSITNLTIQL